MKVERTFCQDGTGVHVQFSVSWHLIGKANEETSEALEFLLQDDDDIGSVCIMIRLGLSDS